MALCIALRTSAQQQPEPPASRPALQQRSPASKPRTVLESATVLKAITHLVVVDAIVTGADGRPVTDLKADDFVVIEDGKEQSLRGFSFQHLNTGAEGGSPATFNLPDNVFTNVPRYNVNTALNIVLLDSLNTSTANQTNVRDQMLRFLTTIPAGQPVAVYTLGSRLRLLQDFTTDSIGLKNTIANLRSQGSPLKENSSGGPEQDFLPPGVVDASMTPEETAQQMLRFEHDNVSFRTDLRLRYTLDVLSALARMLAGYPGRKNLIWISEAFPLTINPNLDLQGDLFADQRNYTMAIANAAESLLDAQVAVYPVDARGLLATRTFEPDGRSRDEFGRSSGGAAPAGMSAGRESGNLNSALANESDVVINSHGSMDELSQRTGGMAFYNRNDMQNAIAASIADGSTYYTLAYSPENKNWNGKFRRIQVRVKRPGMKVRHRLGYFAVNRKAQAGKNSKAQAETFSQALDLNVPASTALRFEAGVLQPSPQNENKLQVNFAIDSHAISYDRQSDGGAHAVIDCAVQAYSEQGKLIKTEASNVNAELTPSGFETVMKQNALLCKDSIDLPPGKYILRLGVRDETTGLFGVTSARVHIAMAPTLQNK
jgi:VWFA-related protein